MQGDLIPGVNWLNSHLTITGVLPSGNTCTVTPTGDALTVVLNGVSVVVPCTLRDNQPNSVWAFAYNGAQGGGDSFTNNTAMNTTANFYGDGNKYVGGSGWSTTHLAGSNNSVDCTRGSGYVFEMGGTGNVVVPSPNVQVIQQQARVPFP